jgi:6-phosphogluconolactonase/glucosamine-6-phosphate isomerase/deaminase
MKMEAIHSSEAEINFYRTKRRHILEQWNPQLGAFRLIVTSTVAISEAFKVYFFVQGQEKASLNQTIISSLCAASV